MKNIILIGAPGSGKTSIGNELAQFFPEKEIIDIEDFLEIHWDCSIKEKLEEVGDENFIEVEGQALGHFDVKNAIVMMSGSSPLHAQSMKKIKKTGVCVYIDTPHDLILNRLEKSRIETIVGQSESSLEEILQYRKNFYEEYHDIRVHVSEEETPQQVAKKLITQLKKEEKFVSTRGFYNEDFSFLEVVKQGLAPDGGLFVPKKLPSFSINEIQRLSHESFSHRAKKILEKFSLGSISPQQIKNMVTTSYKPFHHSGVAPLKKIKKNEYILELFHGPTASFKDMALQLTPKFFTAANQSSGEKFCILAATSGDTGIAAIEGFKKEPNMKVIVLFPKGGVSKIQQAQMLSATGDNVKVLEIDADFDFCQSAVKEIFSDKKLKKELLEKHNTLLSAANSMNWGRLLPQVIYYFSAYADLLDKKIITLGNQIDVSVPCGNFGNILGAYIAKEMGLPIRKFIAASNQNNVLTEFIQTGKYDLRNKKLQLTNSPSIDILKSSNVERFLYFISGGDTDLVQQCFEDLNAKQFFEVPQYILEKIQKNFLAGFTTEEQTGKTIREVFQEIGEIIDTHTAVAIKVAREFEENNTPMVIASTAHFAKFAPAILQYLDINFDENSPEEFFAKIEEKAPRMEMHPDLQNIFSQPILHTDTVSGDIKEITKKITTFVKQ